MDEKYFRYRKVTSAYIATAIVALLYIVFLGFIFRARVSLISDAIILLLIWNTDNILWIVNKLPFIEKKGFFAEDNGALIISYEGKIFKADHITGLSLIVIKLRSQGVKLRIECKDKSVEFLSAYLKRSGVVEETDLYYIFNLILSQNSSLVKVKDSKGKTMKFSYKSND